MNQSIITFYLRFLKCWWYNRHIPMRFFDPAETMLQYKCARCGVRCKV